MRGKPIICESDNGFYLFYVIVQKILTLELLQCFSKNKQKYIHSDYTVYIRFEDKMKMEGDDVSFCIIVF